MTGWAKVPAAAQYAGLKPRSFRDLLKQGLPHSKLPSGTILVRLADIDAFLGKYAVNENRIDAIVNEVMAEVGR